MDLGTITNSTNAVGNTYATKETKQADEVRKYGVTGKTIGQPKLSENAKKYYEELKSKYQNMDFILVSNDMKEMAKANAGSFANPHKMVVLIDEEKIERMATDEQYRKQYESVIASAQNKLPELKQSLGNSANIKGFGMQVNDNGASSFFAVMDKSFKAQADRLEKQRAEKKEEKKAARKKAEKKEREEQLEEKRLKNKDSQEVVITANSIEELKKKIDDYNYLQMADTVKTDAEKYLGRTIDFKGQEADNDYRNHLQCRKKLKNCKTKEEAERLHVNRMNGKLSELKSIVNNPNIPKSEKLKEAQRILGDTTKTAQIHTFTKSAEFKEPPTEEEVMEAKQAEAQLREEQLVGGADENSEVNAESDNETQVVPNISEDDNIVDNAGNTMKDTQHSVALETEKKVLEEMFELEKKHFGESKKAVKIDVSL